MWMNVVNIKAAWNIAGLKNTIIMLALGKLVFIKEGIKAFEHKAQ